MIVFKLDPPDWHILFHELPDGNKAGLVVRHIGHIQDKRLAKQRHEICRRTRALNLLWTTGLKQADGLERCRLVTDAMLDTLFGRVVADGLVGRPTGCGNGIRIESQAGIAGHHACRGTRVNQYTVIGKQFSPGSVTVGQCGRESRFADA